MSNSNEAIAPWYKQPWLWFILSPLIAVFIYGTSYLTLSIVTHDGVVKEDHYKVARGYYKDSTRFKQAKELGVSAELTVDNLTGDLVLKLQGKLDQSDDTLELELIHPTHQKYDTTITLQSIAGTQVYRGNLPSPIKGKRYAMLGAGENGWQIQAEITPPYDQTRFTLDAEGN